VGLCLLFLSEDRLSSLFLDGVLLFNVFLCFLVPEKLKVLAMERGRSDSECCLLFLLL
jgi:hypothetical protein